MKKIIRSDTEENWKKAKNFIPAKDELIEYCGEIKKFKVGDGIHNVNDLPFIDTNKYTIEGECLNVED